MFGSHDSHSRWPEDGHQLVALLRANPGRLALVSGADEHLRDVLQAFGSLLETEAVPVSRVFSDSLPESADAVADYLRGRPLLTDLDILFWKPWLSLDPLRLLMQLARRSPLVAAWPGTVTGGSASYSAPGRNDYYTAGLSDAVVLRARPRRYPDEVPYTAEWTSMISADHQRQKPTQRCNVFFRARIFARIVAGVHED